MPTYRSINIALHSQFDIQTFPEYFPLPQSYYDERGVIGKVPPLYDEKTSTCSIYIPVLPGSQFWIGYSVSPPVPEDQIFLFKLFVNENHIVSWSAEKHDGWKGKTMFSLYEREDNKDGKLRVEKRVLCFSGLDKSGKWKDANGPFDDNAYLEIRVHRAHAKKRVERQIHEFKQTEHAKEGRGIDLVNAGRSGPEHPKRFYQFALIDPIDKPFARFRYYYRTWEQIRDLGLLDCDVDVSTDNTEMSIIEPYDASISEAEENTEDGDMIRREILEDVFNSRLDGTALQQNHFTTSSNRGLRSSTSTLDERSMSAESDLAEHPRAYVPRGAPDSNFYASKKSSRNEARRNRGARTSPHSYRLSVPPSCRLDPPRPSSRPLPTIPQKNDPSVSTEYRPHPAYPMENWVVRTPSPVRSVRDGISTPPLIGKKGFTASGLMNVIATSWKRRGTPSSESSR